jgi:hypothetical protein
MNKVQNAIFPGLIVGCVFMVYFTSLIASPQTAFASNPVESQPAGVSEQVQAVHVSDSGQFVEEVLEPLQRNEPEQVSQASDGCSISAGYPETIQQWCSLIERYAREHALEPNLVAAVMLQESGGNARAFSKSGAVGLMQVMPSDGPATRFMCINGPCFADRPSSSQLYDPEFNIYYGTRMLSDLIRRHGNVRDALKSYGPMDMGYRYADIVLSIMSRY